MAFTPRVILLEFNELTPQLIDRFIDQGHLPHFKRFRGESELFITDAEESSEYLEPWIQWVTVHSGLRYNEHGLFHLDEGHTLKAERVWDVLSDAGHPVWVCGSMNVGYGPHLRGAVLPDPWCTKVPPTPADLTPFFRFVQQNVLEYSNDHVPLSKADYLRFLAFLATHGLSFGGAKDVTLQLLSERVKDGERWKRAVLLDRLQLDVFRAYFRQIQPHFSTFFLNSTAHYQHSYWREMEPDLFTVQAPKGDSGDHSSAILFGYQKMDEILGQFMSLAGDDVTLVFCTALSQQPCLKYEESGGAVFYRPRDFAAVAKFAGLPNARSVAPVMTHQFHLEFAGDADAADADRRLRSITMDGAPAMSIERSGSRVFTGCQFYRDVPSTARLATPDGTSVPFFDVFYKLEAMKSGMHHPDGMLWVRTPARTHAAGPVRVPLTSVAPTLLSLFGVPPPASMKTPALPLLGSPQHDRSPAHTR